MIRKKKKRKVRQKFFHMSYVLMGVVSILAGYGLVILSGSAWTLSWKEPKQQDTLAGSGRLIAAALDRYNEKRFSP